MTHIQEHIGRGYNGSFRNSCSWVTVGFFTCVHRKLSFVSKRSILCWIPWFCTSFACHFRIHRR
ncbi:AAEL012540-PA [Aedes aegypti]|uniref:AAEL012540-PA n=1 Tax=Aedes aegypti TaxID=7159 RepID=Q16LT0_AEDAE|nr:AAEL012540-PA [Aedes aegypti]